MWLLEYGKGSKLVHRYAVQFQTGERSGFWLQLAFPLLVALFLSVFVVVLLWLLVVLKVPFLFLVGILVGLRYLVRGKRKREWYEYNSGKEA